MPKLSPCRIGSHIVLAGLNKFIKDSYIPLNLKVTIRQGKNVKFTLSDKLLRRLSNFITLEIGHFGISEMKALLYNRVNVTDQNVKM